MPIFGSGHMSRIFLHNAKLRRNEEISRSAAIGWIDGLCPSIERNFKMEILLKIDYDGEPYIVLLSDMPALSHTEQCTDSELLELFIRKARQRGLVIKNEADMETRNDYASIRLGSDKA